MVECAVSWCSEKSGKKTDRQFYQIPFVSTNSSTVKRESSQRRRLGFLMAIGKDSQSDSNVHPYYVCSLHFISGKPADLSDEDNPDWIPTQYLGKSRAEIDVILSATKRRTDTNDKQIQNTEKWMTKIVTDRPAMRHNNTCVNVESAAIKMPEMDITVTTKTVTKLTAVSKPSNDTKSENETVRITLLGKVPQVPCKKKNIARYIIQKQQLTAVEMKKVNNCNLHSTAMSESNILNVTDLKFLNIQNRTNAITIFPTKGKTEISDDDNDS